MIESIGHYTILGLLGAGGRGEVYRARDTRVGRTVAIRVLGQRVPDALHRDRFLHEIDVVTRLSHPHIASLFETGQKDGQVYLVYEFVPGEPIRVLTAGHPMNLRRALDLASQVADGLAEAHASDIVHQELTPANIIVTPKGHAKILDFGLAAWEDAQDQHATAARLAVRGAALGRNAAAYMSPEQVLGQTVDHRSDLFSLGTILFEMVTGRPAFAGRNDGETAVQVLQTKMPVPSTINPEVSRDVDAIVAKATAKTLEDRYQSAAQMATELRAASTAALGGRGSIERPAAEMPSRRSGWRRLGVAVVLTLGLAAAVWTWQDDIRRLWRGHFGTQLSPLIVVLPFQLDAEDHSRSYYATGLADDVAMRLGQVPGVSALGRSSLRTFRGRDAAAVAREMGARMALAGVVTPGDDDWTSVSVRVDLVDARDGSTVWTNQYRSASRNILAMEVQVVTDVVTRLRVPVEAIAHLDRAALRLVDPAAYDLYLQARDAEATGDAVRAAELYTGALDRDPSFTEAQAGLALALSTSAVTDARVAYAAVEERMRQAAEQAVTTDPDLPAAHLALGLTASTVREALVSLRRAVELDPSSALTHRAIGNQIRDIDPARAIQFLRRSLELDPAQSAVHLDIAAVDILLGRLDDARLEVARGQALSPSSPLGDGMLARIALGQPRGARAVSTPRQAPDAAEDALGWFARAAAMRAAGSREDAIVSFASLVRLYPDFCEARAMLAALRMDAGDRAEGLRLASQILRDASAPGASAAWGRCAAMAASALSDAEGTASWINRAAAGEAARRQWTNVNGMMSAQAAIRQGLYPWSNVIAQPAVVQALAGLDRAMMRTRAEIATILKDLPTQPLPAGLAR